MPKKLLLLYFTVPLYCILFTWNASPDELTVQATFSWWNEKWNAEGVMMLAKLCWYTLKTSHKHFFILQKLYFWRGYFLKRNVYQKYDHRARLLGEENVKNTKGWSCYPLPHLHSYLTLFSPVLLIFCFFPPTSFTILYSAFPVSFWLLYFLLSFWALILSPQPVCVFC